MRGLSPVLVTSPTIRSGTTLVQRLLCSSSNGLVYGEEIGKDLMLQLQIFMSRKMLYAHSRQHFAGRLDQVVNARGDDWIVDLMPDLDDYLQALQDGAFAGLDSCRRHAASAGRTLWGFKYPGWPPQLLRMLVDCLPDTRVIYVHRGLEATARSAKAWNAIPDEAAMQAFCAEWSQHRRFMQEWQAGRQVLMLPLESLVDEPEAAIARIQAFLPFEDIDRSLLERRINRSAGQPGGAYLEPAALTEREQAWVDAAANAG